MIDKIDGFCIRNIQKISQYLEQRTGKNNIFFAKLFNTISILLATPILILIYSYPELSEKLKFALAMLPGILMLMGFSNFLNFWHKARLEKQVKESKNVTKADLTMQLVKHSDNFFRWWDYLLLLQILVFAYYLPIFVCSALVLQMALHILANLLVLCEPVVRRQTLHS